MAARTPSDRALEHCPRTVLHFARSVHAPSKLIDWSILEIHFPQLPTSPKTLQVRLNHPTRELPLRAAHARPYCLESDTALPSIKLLHNLAVLILGIRRQREI